MKKLMIKIIPVFVGLSWKKVKTWRISGIEKGSVTVIIPFEFRRIPLKW